jgi:Fe-S-cluster containining protein
MAFRADPEGYPLAERIALAAFPFTPRKDGSCPKLDLHGRCTVYEDRPLICRIEAMGVARGLTQAVSWQRAAAACNALQREDGLPDVFRVVLPELEIPPPPPHASHPVDGV